jgi:glycosyltransferase involved in cell wall biosynthesis
MTRIHILTPHLIPGDAVSNDVFGMVRWFRLRNWHADAYAQYIDCSLKDQAQPLTAYQRHRNNRDDLLIYHHSVGWEQGLNIFAASRNRKVLKYHSVTPARFYRPYHARYARDCLQGEFHTRSLLRLGADAILADSTFNAHELIAAGAEPSRCQVVPPFHTIGAQEPLAEDETLAEQLREEAVVLFVGRVVPNKGHLHLIRAFAYYHHYLNPQSRLAIVGRVDPQLSAYMADLRWEVARHEVEPAVQFTGLVTARQLRTYYAHASVFLCLSEHEGFCVPLVEAMHSRLPIIAFGSTAIPETLGDTGLVWDTTDPALLAQSMHTIQERSDLREDLVLEQLQRYGDRFTNEAISTRFEEVIAPLLASAEAYA